MKAVWLLAAGDDVLWGYRCPHRTKADFSFARVLVDILVAGKRRKTMMKAEAVSGQIGLAACLWIFLEGGEEQPVTRVLARKGGVDLFVI